MPSKFARDLRIWTTLGQLRDDVVRGIAARLQAGESYDAISAAIGIGKRTGRRKCAEIAAALDMPAEESAHVVFARQVAALVEQGLTDTAIAARLDRTIDSVASARKRALGTKYKVVRLTATDHAKIDQMIRDGFNQYEIAREVGCHQTLVSTRAKRIDPSEIRPVRAPCTCGKPAGHGGRCFAIVDPAFIRGRLISGATVADIARELGRSAQSFKPQYCQPVIDQLTAEGILCGCGKPFGHRFVCTETMAAQRLTFTEEQRVRAAEVLRAQGSIEALRREMSLSQLAGRKLGLEVRRLIAADGTQCGCGKPFDHPYSCSARYSAAGQHRPRITYGTSAMNMSAQARRLATKLAREGWNESIIVRRTGETEWRVSQLVQDVIRSGVPMSASCPSCGAVARHRGACRVPKRCECGRWRHHRGLCRTGAPRKTVKNGDKAPTIAPDLRRQAMLRYRDGDSARRISNATGIALSQVHRLVAYWRKSTRYEQKPCVCGRPARHPGGCVKNTPAAVGKLERARIKDAIRAGEMPHRIAERLGLSVQTVLKHSADTRDALFAEGISCACGRQIGHPHWCSSKWDAFDQPRGRRPFPEQNERRAIDALLRGDIVADIAKAVEVGTDSIWRLRRSLTDDQRSQRTTAIRARIARGGHREGAAIMARIEAAVSRRLDPALRDDVVGELYLAVMEGRLEVEQIPAAVRSFVSRGLAQWQSAFGPKSLDATIGDTELTIGDRVRDDSTAEQLDDFTLGGE